MSKPTDILCSDSYVIGEKYTMSGASSFGMSCYGYHFAGYWMMDGGTVGISALSDGCEYVFNDVSCEVCAAWDRNVYEVTFIDGMTYEEISTQNIPYMEKASNPPQHPDHSPHVFTGWDPDVSQYQITSDTSVYAKYQKMVSLTYTLNTDSNTSPSVEYYPISSTDYNFIDLDSFDKSKMFDSSGENRERYTLSNYLDGKDGNPTTESEFGMLSVDRVVYINDLKNQFLVDFHDQTYTWDGNPHTISVSVDEITCTPYTPTQISIKYAGIDKVYNASPIIESTNDTSTTIWLNVSSEGFYSYETSAMMRITQKEKHSVSCYFRDVQNDVNLICCTVYSVPHLDNCTPATPTDTISSVFTAWNDPSKLQKVSEERSVSALYTPKTFTVKFHKDGFDDDPYGLIESKTVTYGGSSSHAPYTRDGWYTYPQWYNKDGGALELLNITENLSAYAYLRKMVNLSVYQVYGTTCSCVYKIENSQYLLSGDSMTGSQISSQAKLVTPDGYVFDRWIPSSWNPIDKDTSVSAVYEANEGTLTYHSNYPEDES